MFDKIDAIIDNITMYKLVLYYLIFLVIAAAGLSYSGALHFNGTYILISAIICSLACWVINKVFSYIFDAPTNSDSSIITGLILSLIISPNPTGFGLTFLLAAAGLAIASKYLLTINKKHIFNPAAIAVTLTALGPKQSASWWVGSVILLPFVLLGGILIIRKLHRVNMVVSFFVFSFLATIVYSILGNASIYSNLHNLIISSSVLFLGFVMLTEPLTSPHTHRRQIIYGAIVGMLVPPQVHILSIYSTPEIALILGNIFAYIVSPKDKLFPVLIEKYKVARNTVDFVFNPQAKLAFQPGQYLEWTLEHTSTDVRGSRRYFTIASAPTEKNLRIGVKFYENGSSYKSALLASDESTLIAASQLSGEFTLPKDKTKKLVFIAGGIGITPFRSMVKYLSDVYEKRDIILIYANNSIGDIAYKDIFDEAVNKIGLKSHYLISNPIKSNQEVINSKITQELISKLIPDYQERVYYLAGSHHFVKNIKHYLTNLDIHRHNIKVDYFPGYA